MAVGWRVRNEAEKERGKSLRGCTPENFTETLHIMGELENGGKGFGEQCYQLGM